VLFERVLKVKRRCFIRLEYEKIQLLASAFANRRRRCKNPDRS